MQILVILRKTKWRRDRFLRVDLLRFAPHSIIPQMLDIHTNLNVALTRRINDRSLRTFQNAMVFWKTGSVAQKSIFTSNNDSQSKTSADKATCFG
jgi:hypothetical protein